MNTLAFHTNTLFLNMNTSVCVRTALLSTRNTSVLHMNTLVYTRTSHPIFGYEQFSLCTHISFSIQTPQCCVSTPQFVHEHFFFPHEHLVFEYEHLGLCIDTSPVNTNTSTLRMNSLACTRTPHPIFGYEHLNLYTNILFSTRTSQCCNNTSGCTRTPYFVHTNI